MNIKKTILLYSKSKKNIDKITSILEGKNYILQTEKTIKDLSFHSDAARLLIIDISDLQSVGDIKLRELLSDIEKLSMAKIIIIDRSQIKFLFKNIKSIS